MRHSKTTEKIVRDGILDNMSFKKGPLFILMEPNGKDLIDSSLPASLLNKQKRGKLTHKNLAMWTRMLLEEQPELNLEICPQDVDHFLRRAAVINLKKCPGEGRVKYGDIRRAIECETNRQRIVKQIKDIRPSKIVLCFCQELQKIFEDRFSGLLPSKTPIICFRHPARAGYQKSQEQLLERLQDCERGIRDREDLRGAR